MNFDGARPYQDAAAVRSRRETVPVGSLPANGFGLHEMHGNVWEWCEDVFDPEFYGKEAARRADPVCTEGGRDRVFRGGSWYSSAGACRSARRHKLSPTGSSLNLGFRPVAHLE